MTFVAVETFLSTTNSGGCFIALFNSTDVLYRFLQYRLLLHCLSATVSMVTAVPPGLCSATIRQEKGFLTVNARKILEMLSYVMKNCRNPTFFWVTA